MVVVNQGVAWDPLELPNRADGDSLECVGAHEFGHVLGLDHEDDHPASMNSVYVQFCDAGNRLRIGEDDYAALVNFHPGSSTGLNLSLSKFNVDDSTLANLQEVWSSSTRRAEQGEYELGAWRACLGHTCTVDELAEPILASTTSTSDIAGVEIEWRLAPAADACFGGSSIVIGTKVLGLVVNAPASVTSTVPWTVPYTLSPGSYKLCARIDPSNSVSETSEADQVVISEFMVYIADPALEPALCNGAGSCN